MTGMDRMICDLHKIKPCKDETVTLFFLLVIYFLVVY